MARVISMSEIPQTLTATRKAQDAYKVVLQWLKIARKNADENNIKRELEDIEFDTMQLAKGLSTIQNNVRTRDPRTRSNRSVGSVLTKLR